MSNVFVDKTKIDNLANAISAKSGESVPMTLTEMTQAVDGIDTSGGGGGITPTGNIDITQAGVTDVTNYATATVPQGDVYVDAYRGYFTTSGVRKWHYQPYAAINVGDSYGDVGFIADEYYNEATDHVFNAVPSGTTVTPSTSSQTIGGANYMMEGAVTVSAMPSGSVTAPSTISGTSATVSTGTNTLTLSKTISVTPNVTTSGYVSSGTAGNSNVSLTASVTTKGATTYTPTTTNQTISSGTYLTGTQTISGDANLVAGNIKSGTTIFGVTGTYSGGGGSSKNVQTVQSTSRTTSTSLTKVSGEITVATTGTYDVYWTMTRSSTSGTWSSRLYVGSTATGSEQTTFSNHVQTVHLTNISLTANQKVSVYAKSRGSNYYAYVPQLTIVQT